MKILFLDGTKGFTPNRLNEKPTGGILTSLTHVPRYLVTRGHDVSCATMHRTTETVGGVKYLGDPIAKNDYDVVVFNRNLMDRSMVEFFKDSYKVWWLHDIPDPRYMTDDSYLRMNHVVALSDYNARSFSSITVDQSAGDFCRTDGSWCRKRSLLYRLIH